MNGRTLFALLFAPVASGAVFAYQVMSTVPINSIPIQHRPEAWFQFAMGVITGVLFELFVLLPLLYALQRVRKHGRLLLICLGTLFWFLATFGLMSFMATDWNGRITTSVMYLVPGIMLVVAFGALVRQGAMA